MQFGVWLTILLLCAAPVFAQSTDEFASTFEQFAPPQDESVSFHVETLISGLDNPAGVSVRSTQATRGPYELFFSESGAGRVLRVSTDAVDAVEEVVVDFPLGTLGVQPEYRVGPLALGFITRTKLAVSSQEAASGAVRLAAYGMLPGSSALKAGQLDHAVGPLDQSINPQFDGLQFCGLAMAEKSCFVTSVSAGTANSESGGWILKSGVEANRLSYLQPFIDVRKIAGSEQPGGIAVIPPPRPSFLVVALMGSPESPQDSQLAFFSPASGELVMSLPTGLDDIIGLAYSPTGQLYAADFSWRDESLGGVFRLDDARIDGRQTCRAVKIASIARPYGLAFAPDGSLFVTAFGAGENEKQGKLIKITGKL